MTDISRDTYTDKSTWGAGPWQLEPDRVEWRDEATGLPCLIVRGPSGALCGYAAVAPGHPWHGVEYNRDPRHPKADPWEEPASRNRAPDFCVEVHRGLTYSGACAGHICHAPADGEPDSVWWFGFDCAHLYDLCPARPSFGEETYRDEAFVRRHVTSLARQLAAVGGAT